MYRTVRRASLCLFMVVVVPLTGCSEVFGEDVQGSGAGTQITVGSSGVPEGRVLAEVYGQALEDHSYDVSYNFGAGSRAGYLRLMQDGAIDIVPDYSLSLLTNLLPTARARSTVDIGLAVKENLADIGLKSSLPASAENGRTLVVTRTFAEANNLTTVADLRAISRTLVIGGTAEFEGSDAGRAALQKEYAIEGWTLYELASDDEKSAVDALKIGDINVAILTAASPFIAGEGLVALRDTSLLFRANNVIPVLSSKADTRSIVEIVDAVSEKLTTEALRDLIARQANSRAPGDAVIARDWLLRTQLIAD